MADKNEKVNNDIYNNIEEIVKKAAENVAQQFGGTILDNRGIKSITDGIYKQYMKDNNSMKSQEYAQQQIDKIYGDSASTPAPKGSDYEKMNPAIIDGISGVNYGY